MLSVLLALAAPGQRNFADPEAAMSISNLTADTDSAGACPALPATTPTPSASLRLKWRTTNRDDEVYRVDVAVDLSGGIGIFALPLPAAGGAVPMPENWIFGWPFGRGNPVWAQGWTDDKQGFGVLTYSGYVEAGPARVHTTNWTFVVKLVRIADETVVQTLFVPWRKTYGSCGH